ncbi:MAG: ThiF family adenylyltransferase [Pyrinomonadaceae bacterium]
MKQFSVSNSEPFPDELLERPKDVETFKAMPVPASHPAEPDVFVRHEGVPGHDQPALADARIFLVGGGGLNSWVALALARCGAGSITIADDDLVDRTNLSRQVYFAEDLGHRKGVRLARNIVSHAVGGASITGIPLRFEEAIEQFALPADVLVVGVDNNACRLGCVREARKRHIPAVFTMLSRDGMRCQCFLQGASALDPCLWCALPNLDPESSSPCASAIISSCLLAASFTVTFVYRALMGWPQGVNQFNWREADLLDVAPATTADITRRPDCPICGDV